MHRVARNFTRLSRNHVSRRNYTTKKPELSQDTAKAEDLGYLKIGFVVGTGTTLGANIIYPAKFRKMDFVERCFTNGGLFAISGILWPITLTGVMMGGLSAACTTTYGLLFPDKIAELEKKEQEARDRYYRY